MSPSNQSRFDRLLDSLQSLLEEERTAIREENWDYGDEVVARKQPIIDGLVALGAELNIRMTARTPEAERLRGIMEVSAENGRLLESALLNKARERGEMRRHGQRLSGLRHRYGKGAEPATAQPQTTYLA